MSHPLNAAKADPESPTTPNVEGRPAVPTNGQTIALSLSSISQQLPGNFLATVGTENIRHITVNIPAEWVLPQLARGRITITLADLMPLLPEDIQRRPLPPGNSQHAIVLPLADIVSALPVDLMQPQNQTEVDLDTPEFAQFPNLIDDVADKTAAEEKPAIQESAPVEELQTPTPEVSARSAEETLVPEAPTPAPVEEEEQPAPRALSGNMARPIPAANEAPAQPAASLPASDGTEAITVSLRSLVAVMPDQYFICPRTDLWRRIDLDTRIALPSDLVIPQLKIARVRLPLAVAVGLIPRSILATPLPSISDETIPIALQEIVPQLPLNLFASQTRQSDLHEIDFSDSEIPTPFAEKNFPPATVEIRASESTQLSPLPVPVQPKQPAETVEVASGALEDEAVSIFAEKPATAESVVEPPSATEDTTVESSTSVEPTTIGPVAEAAPSQVEATEVPIFAEVPKAVEPTTTATETGATEPAATEQRVVEPVSSEPIAEVVTPAPVAAQPATQIEPELAEAAAQAATPAPVATEQPVPAETQQSIEQTVAIPQPAEVAPIGESVTPPDETTTTEAGQDVQAPEPAVPASTVGSTPDQVLANLNRWSLADLARIEGIGPVLAQRIIEFRNTHGGFKSIEDLHRIPGVGRRLFRSLASPSRRGLNRLLGVEHNNELTLQEIVRLTSQLKGVAGCILAMSDGVFLTGELPPHLDRETISVFAPQLFRKVGRYMKELRAGQVTRLSVFTDQQPISILRAGDIFLIVLHDNRHFSKALLRRCERISQELARLCRQRTVE
ncbi:MAG: helix-hairpin-helix domain-containing protein [Verrucomicrobiia bacterium]|jgi:competence protein ComEA